ncbi:hypothetical protein TWF481_006227 [Arthrobotrys musiformis]|uniref:Uncharacterized protein n=1 Tax=Arthrobotrys musiformis TaxID=47236 RepID=A0AAV9WI32_9PEZI
MYLSQQAGPGCKQRHDATTVDTDVLQISPNQEAFEVTGFISVPCRLPLEYRVVTMAMGPPPLPTTFFEKNLIEEGLNETKFSQWSYESARQKGSCVHENQQDGEYIWAWKMDENSPLAITTALFPTQRLVNLPQVSATLQQSRVRHDGQVPSSAPPSQNPAPPSNAGTPSAYSTRAQSSHRSPHNDKEGPKYLGFHCPTCNCSLWTLPD